MFNFLSIDSGNLKFCLWGTKRVSRFTDADGEIPNFVLFNIESNPNDFGDEG